MRATVLMAVTMAALVFSTAAMAQTWDCGATPGTVTAAWSDGTLTVSGTGAMGGGIPPWSNVASAITRVVIGDGVTSVGDMAFGVFNNYPNLTSVTIGNSVTSIGVSAFSGCTGLTSVTIGNSVTSIGSGAFSGCTGLTSLTLPGSVTTIGGMAFENCTGLTSVTIGNSVTSIGEMAFMMCSGLTSLTIPNSVTSIGMATFSGCSGLTSLTIPNSVTSIGMATFSGCSGLTSLTIPNSVISIGDAAFSDCSGLTSLTIPSSVTSIGMAAFSGCTSLTSVTSLRTVPTNIGICFYEVDLESACLYVPEASILLYRTADEWKDFGCIQAAPVSVRHETALSAKKGCAISVRPNSVIFTAADGRAITNLSVLNLKGRRVFGKAGAYSEIKWDSATRPKGMYLVKMTMSDGAAIQRNLMLK